MVRTMTVIAWVVTVFFLFAGTVKVFGWPVGIFDRQMTTYFDAYGISRNLVRVIGVAELFGGVTIWLHRRHWIGLAGAATLVVVTSGAIVFHLRYDTVGQAVPALVMWLFSGSVLLTSGVPYLRRQQMKAQLR